MTGFGVSEQEISIGRTVSDRKKDLIFILLILVLAAVMEFSDSSEEGVAG